MRQKLMIYHLFVCKHRPRYKLVTTWRSFIAPTGLLSLLNIVGEKQSGLGSIFSIKCSYCGHVNEVKSSEEHRAGNRGPPVSDINTRAVLGSLHAGMGNTHLNNLLSTMNIPTMNHRLFKRREREVGNAVENVARESCEVNLNLEKSFWAITWSIERWPCWNRCFLRYGMAEKGKGTQLFDWSWGCHGPYYWKSC